MSIKNCSHAHASCISQCSESCADSSVGATSVPSMICHAPLDFRIGLESDEITVVIIELGFRGDGIALPTFRALPQHGGRISEVRPSSEYRSRVTCFYDTLSSPRLKKSFGDEWYVCVYSSANDTKKPA